jgi:hypothetical protein
VVFEFEFSGVYLDEAIARVGHVPLPPYIASKRPEDAQDRADYQTVYARDEGSVAAPTAGLHFTPDLMERLRARGISLHFLTLHVGAGTFLPVKADDTDDAQACTPNTGCIDGGDGGPRSTPSARGGPRRSRSAPPRLRLIWKARQAEDGMSSGPFEGETSIFITPGYHFRADRRADHQLPPAALDPVHAGLGTDAGLETDAGRLCACDRDRLSLLFSYGDSSLLLRRHAYDRRPRPARCVPDRARTGDAAPAGCRPRPDPTDDRRAGGDGDRDVRQRSGRHHHRAEFDAGVRRSFELSAKGQPALGYIAFGDWSERWLGNRNALPSPFEVDGDGDNRITLPELQARFDLFFTRFDTDKDGSLRRSELLTVRAMPTPGQQPDRRRRDS